MNKLLGIVIVIGFGLLSGCKDEQGAQQGATTSPAGPAAVIPPTQPPASVKPVADDMGELLPFGELKITGYLRGRDADASLTRIDAAKWKLSGFIGGYNGADVTLTRERDGRWIARGYMAGFETGAVITRTDERHWRALGDTPDLRFTGTGTGEWQLSGFVLGATADATIKKVGEHKWKMVGYIGGCTCDATLTATK